MRKIRVSVVGVGSLQDILRYSKISKNELNISVKQIAKTLAEFDVELIALTGIEIELAKFFKLQGGNTVIATLPIEDKVVGIKHLQKYIEMDIRRFPLFDGFIDTKSWFETDFIRPIAGDILLVLGYSPGTLLEISAGVYIYKILSGKKGDRLLNIDKDLRRQIFAGSKIPFEIWIYLPFVSKRLPKELEDYCKDVGVILRYIKDIEDLENNLRKIAKKWGPEGP